jgi:hypothetical protein
MSDFMYKATSKEAWEAFALSMGIIDEEGVVQQPFAIDVIGYTSKPGRIDTHPFLVNIRVAGEVVSFRNAPQTDDCVWIDPATVSTPTRIFAGGMSYYSTEPLPEPAEPPQ